LLSIEIYSITTLNYTQCDYQCVYRGAIINKLEREVVSYAIVKLVDLTLFDLFTVDYSK